MKNSKNKKPLDRNRIGVDKAHGSEVKNTGKTASFPFSQKLAYKLSEAAKMISVSNNTLRAMIKNGEIRYIGKIRHILITHEALMDFLTRNAIGGQNVVS